jgi:tetratricopeptide (TPR) repeat protein
MEEATAQGDRALELEPLSPIMNSNQSFIYLLAHRYSEAADLARRTTELYPHFAPPFMWLGLAEGKLGNYSGAVEALKQSVSLSDSCPPYLGALGYTYAVHGKEREARTILEQLLERAKSRYGSAYDFAVIYSGLGDSDTALDWLEKAHEERAAWLIVAAQDFRLDCLRGHSRFIQVLRQAGLSA